MTERKHAVQIYTGDGKGKSTACFGLAMRARGRGWQVRIVQFMKLGEYGELDSAQKLGIPVEQFGRKGFMKKGNPAEEDLAVARRGWERVLEIIADEKIQCDLLIADELCTAVDFGLIPLDEVTGLLDSKPELELVLSGRNANPELVKRADLVSEVLAIKHPFNDGMPAREGIEF